MFTQTRTLNSKFIKGILFTVAFFVIGFYSISFAHAVSPGEIIISEFSSTTNPEWIGIKNTSTSAIDVSGWKITELTDPQGTPTETDLTILSGEIKPDSTLIIKTGSNKLNNTGDSIGLYDNSVVPVLLERITFGTILGTDYPTTIGLETEVATGQYAFKDDSNTWNISAFSINTAKSDVNNAYNSYTETDYSPDNWTELTKFKTDFYENTEFAADLASLEIFKITAIEGMAGVKTISAIFENISYMLTSADIANNIDTVTSSNYSNFTGLYLEKRTDVDNPFTAIGRITFNQSLDLSSTAVQTLLLNLSDESKIDITSNHIKLDSNAALALGSTGANISFYGLSSNYQPTLTVKDDENIVLDQNLLITDTSYTDSLGACEVGKSVCKTFSFNTAHFTQFDLSDSPEMITAVAAINGANFTNIASVFSNNAFALNLETSKPSDYFYLIDKTIVHKALVEQAFPDGKSVKSAFDTAVSNQKIAELSKAKSITGFTLSIPSTPTVINESAHTISLNVPYGTNITSLVPTIVITGNSISPASGVSQDFTAPVTYTVTALDSSTQVYVVTISLLSSNQILEAPTIELNGAQSEVIVYSDTDIIITTPDTITNAALNINHLTKDDGTTTTATLPLITLITTTSLSTTPIKVEIPRGTVVTAPTGWNGIINIPTIKENSSVNVTPDSGNSADTLSVIEIGYGDVKLTFDKAVRVLIPGQSGKDVGYSRGKTFTKITNVCANDSQTSGDALSTDGDCKIDVGTDLVIWTKHFTKFVTYTQTANRSTTSGSYLMPRIILATTETSVTPENIIKTVDEGDNIPETGVEKANPKKIAVKALEIEPMTNEAIEILSNNENLSGREMLANSLAASVGKIGSIFNGPMSVGIILILIIILLGGGFGVYSLLRKDNKLEVKKVESATKAEPIVPVSKTPVQEVLPINNPVKENLVKQAKPVINTPPVQPITPPVQPIVPPAPNGTGPSNIK